MAFLSYSFDSLPTDSIATARDALNGLAVGDAFGAQFFVPDNLPALRDQRLPEAPWPWTDDTEMACSIHQLVMHQGEVDPDELARSFAVRHDFDRGYGPAMNRLLRLIREGGSPSPLPGPRSLPSRRWRSGRTGLPGFGHGSAQEPRPRRTTWGRRGRARVGRTRWSGS